MTDIGAEDEAMVKENVGGAPRLCKQIESAERTSRGEMAKAVVDEPPWVPQGTSRDVLPAKTGSRPMSRLAREPSPLGAAPIASRE